MPDAFVLQCTPTLRDWEMASAARRRATRDGWVTAGVLTLLTAVAVAEGSWVVAAGWLTLGVAVGSGWWGKWYMRLFVWRRNPGILEPATTTVDAAGVHEVQSSSDSRLAWSHFASTLVLEDLLLLSTSAKRNGQTLMLVRRGLTAPERWDELVGFVAARVPLHPRSPVNASGLGPT